MVRLFIAAALTDEIKKNIAELIQALSAAGAAVKWVAPPNLHVTLKFLGWVEERQADEVIALTARAVGETKSFRLRLKGVGTFPPGRAPRVLWAGISEGEKELAGLANALEKHFAAAGYRSEEREFSSHITFGRVKDKKGVDQLKEKLAAYERAEFGAADVGSIFVMKSTLTPKGPVYEILKEVKL